MYPDNPEWRRLCSVTKAHASAASIQTDDVFSASDQDRWTWEEWDSGPVTFAVWTLLDDGLRVEPFVEHAEGNGSLRAAGLDADTWHAWLLALVARHAQAQASLFQGFREYRLPHGP